MADKLLSLVNVQRTIRYHDIWDLRWLSQQGAQPNGELVAKKIADYGIEQYEDKLKAFRGQLDEIITSAEFRETMTRFIPADVHERTLGRPGFERFLIQETDRLLGEIARQLASSEGFDDYRS